jgi:Domain of unknown function (DUF4398)
MRVARGLRLVLLACTLAGLAACAEPPNKEMNQAQGAIDAARAAGADRFAAEEFGAAVTALEKSRAAVEQRDYRQALSHALDARERAQVAARTASDEKARLHASSDRALHTAELALDKAKTALERAEAANVPARDLATQRTAVAEADRVIREARGAIERDDFAAGVGALDGLPARLATVASQIDAATEAQAARRPSRRTRQ